MQKIRAILFDLDNTLSDFMLMKEEACKAAVRAMVAAGLNMTEKAAYDRLMETYFELGLESDVAFTEFLRNSGEFNHKILAAAINAYLKTKSNFVKPYPRVKSVLRKLQKQGVVLSVITDAPKTKAYQRLLKMGIEPYFKFVVGFEDTDSKKQTGLPFRLALSELKKELPDVKEPEILMVGDSVERDVQPAKKLGLKTALAKYGQRTQGMKIADYELNNIKDLENIVKSFEQ
jgi:putative hydrolase of the HAD superfamily